MWLCENSRGFWGCPWLRSALNTPCNQKSYLCHLAHLALHLCLLYISPLSPFSMSCPRSPPLHFSLSFLSSRKTLVSGKRWSSCHFCFSHPPLPRAIVADPSFVCVLRLLLKIKNSPLHPLYCFLVGCPCHSLGFYVLAGYPSSFPLQRLALLSAFSLEFFFPKGNK